VFWILVLEKKKHKSTIHNNIIISIIYTKSAFKPSTCVLVHVCTSKVYVLCKGNTAKVMVEVALIKYVSASEILGPIDEMTSLSKMTSK